MHLNVYWCEVLRHFVAGVKLEVSLTQKRLMFFRAFNSLYGSVGANFSRIVLKIIIAKTHTVHISVNGEVKWSNDIIKTHIIKQYTKWNKLCHDESLLNMNTAKRYTAAFRKSTVYNAVTFNTAIFFFLMMKAYWITVHPWVVCQQWAMDSLSTKAIYVSEQVYMGWHRTDMYYTSKLTLFHDFPIKVWDAYYTSVRIIFKFLR